MSYGKLTSENIRLSRTGSVKISESTLPGFAALANRMAKANFWESTWDSSASSQEQQDVRSLGLVMVEMMEPGTSLEDPNTLILKGLRPWSGEIKSFLKKTENAGIKDMLQVCLTQRLGVPSQ